MVHERATGAVTLVKMLPVLLSVSGLALVTWGACLPWVVRAAVPPVGVLYTRSSGLNAFHVPAALLSLGWWLVSLSALSAIARAVALSSRSAASRVASALPPLALLAVAVWSQSATAGFRLALAGAALQVLCVCPTTAEQEAR